jgi:hypothetical protein
MFINPSVEKSCKTPLCDLFEVIDKKIAQYGLEQLNNIRFGFNTNINYDAYEDIIVYKDILRSVVNNADWMCDVNVNQVISKIRKLTNSLC